MIKTAFCCRLRKTHSLCISHFKRCHIPAKVKEEQISSCASKLAEVRSRLSLNPMTIWSLGRKHVDQSLRFKMVAVDFSSPNIAKPFHIGHLRSTFLGNFIANLYRDNGIKCHKINYLGDFGTQFGLLANGFEKFGPQVDLDHINVRNLHDIYVQANKEADVNVEFANAARNFGYRLEIGDQEALKFWRRIRELGVEYLKKLYSQLGIEFDIWQSESEFVDAARKFVEEKIAANLLYRTEDGIVGVKTNTTFYDNEKKRLCDHLRIIPLMKSDSSTLYLTRDVAAAIHRVDCMNFDQIVYVVDQNQSGHFRDLKSVLTALGREDVAEKITHLKFGLIKDMSTRKGQAVFVDDMLEHGVNLALGVLNSSPFTKSSPEQFSKLAPVMAKTAFLVNDFKRKRTVNYEYNWEKVLKPSGDNGYMLQACYARLCSLEEKFGDFDADSVDVSKMTTFLGDPEAVRLIDHLTSNLPQALASTFEDLDPSFLIKYSFELAHLANASHKKLKVLGSDADIALARMYMFSTARLLLGYVLRLIGTEPLSKL